MSKHINSWSTLVPFGINYLTGESCPFSLRGLCDLSAKGCQNVASFLGLPLDARFQKNWNSTVGNDEAVASIMLPPAILEPFAIFLLFTDYGADIVLSHNGQISGYMQHEIDGFYPSALASLEAAGAKVLYNPKRGTRNVHMATGRTD
jgi:hypothetical protein